MYLDGSNVGQNFTAGYTLYNYVCIKKIYIYIFFTKPITVKCLNIGKNIGKPIYQSISTDHFCIFFDILISVTTESRSVSVRKRCINENTSVLFMKAISLTPSISADSVDLLLD